MGNAKQIAKRMLKTVNIDDEGLLLSFAKGAISLSVSMFYLGYEYLDSENRGSNARDHYRMALLFKSGMMNSAGIEIIIKIVINEFISKVDINRVKKIGLNFTSELAGKIAFTQLTGVNLGRIITTGIIKTSVAGAMLGLTLGVGADSSRAIYTSRKLEDRNPNLHNSLKKAGNLDLLYFAIEDKIEVFEEMCLLSRRDKTKFNEVCDYFFGGMHGQSGL